MEYKLIRTCADCKQEDTFEITKEEAAFELYDSSAIYQSPCSNCGSMKCASISHPRPDIDAELLNIWGNNREIHFYEQDEEIILAEIDNVDLFLHAIDHSAFSQSKKDILLSALCILLYDNMVNPEEYTDKENKESEKIVNTLLPELKKRKELIKQIPDWLLWEYVTTLIYPLIGIK